MILENSEDDTVLILNELNKGGYDPQWHRVDSENEFKAALKIKTWDVILADYRLPRFSGLYALQIVKERGLDIPFIIVSNAAGEAAVVEAMRAGAHDYIIRDQLSRLIPVVERELKESEIRRKQKYAEAALKESEEKLRLLFFNANEGILTLDMKGKILDVNPKFLDLIKFEYNEIIGKGILELAKMFKISPKRVLSRFNAFISGKAKNTVWVIKTKHGDAVYLFVSPSFIKKDGKKVGISVFITDITESKKAEIALRENERFLYSVIEGIQDGLSVLDTDLKIIRTNTWIEKMYSDQLPLTGKKCYQVYQLRNEPCPWCPSIITLKTGQKHRAIVPYPAEEHPKGWIDLTSFPLRDSKGNILGIIEHVKDTTDHRKAEEALKHSEAMYRSLIEQSNDAIYLLYDNKFEIINRRFTEMFGYTIQETNALDFNFMDLVSPQSRPMIEERVHKLATGENLNPVYEFTALNKAGESVECETSVNYIDYKGGKAVQGIIRDITGRKQAEVKIKASLR